jgi:hypothetical protein
MMPTTSLLVGPMPLPKKTPLSVGTSQGVKEVRHGNEPPFGGDRGYHIYLVNYNTETIGFKHKLKEKNKAMEYWLCLNV